MIFRYCPFPIPFKSLSTTALNGFTFLSFYTYRSRTNTTAAHQLQLEVRLAAPAKADITTALQRKQYSSCAITAPYWQLFFIMVFI